MKNYLRFLLLLTITVVLITGSLWAQITTVHQTDVSTTWFTADTRPGGSSSFDIGPGIPPLGTGSLHIYTNGGSAKVQMVNYSFIGTKLSDITAMSYYAYRTSGSTNSSGQTIGLNIEVDFKGDGTSYTTLVFEPVYQSGGVGAMHTDVWQLWDAFNGGNAKWWSTKDLPNAGVYASNSFVTWNSIVISYPNAKILGIFGFSCGSGWSGQFSGYADALTIGVSGTNTIYDFEPALPRVHNITQGTGFYDIQPAINAANPGDVIKVDAGTYPEQLTITKPLTLNGADGAILDGTTLGLQKVGVKIKSGNVTFNNIEVANFSGNGIIVGYEASIPGSLKNIHITNCKISVIQPGYSHGFGIYVGYESEAFKYIPPKLTAHLDYSGLLIENNEICNTTSSALVLQSITGYPGTLVVRNNYIHDGNNDGIWIDCARNILIEDNTLLRNMDAIYISSYADSKKAPYTTELNSLYSPQNIQIIGNQIRDSKEWGGIYLEAGWPATIAINGNSITGNTPEGVANYLTEQVNATCNWWGSVDGPNGAGGSAVTANVTFYPWSLSYPSNYCGPIAKVEKQFAKDVLVNYLSGNPDKKIRKAVEKAIESIDKSLESELWADPDRLTKKGNKVFDEEKHAVKELTDKKFGDLFSGAINHLLAADLTLAQVAINDAVVACNGDKHCQHEIDKANEELAKAAKELADNDYEKAIDHYKNAWEHAQKAVKKSVEESAANNSQEDAVNNSVTIPESFTLNQNYPNPFNPSTVIKFGIPEASFVTLKIYNMLGQEIKTLVSGEKAAGYYNIQWNGDNNYGSPVASGAYIYRITAGSNVVNKKMILMK